MATDQAQISGQYTTGPTGVVVSYEPNKAGDWRVVASYEDLDRETKDLALACPDRDAAKGKAKELAELLKGCLGKVTHSLDHLLRPGSPGYAQHQEANHKKVVALVEDWARKEGAIARD